MNTKNLILNSLKPILDNSNSVSINKDKIPELAEKIKDYPLPGWDNTLQYLGDPEQTAQYYFFLDSLNFCFWAQRGQERWSIEKDGERLQGYYAFSYAIKKAFENNPQLFNAKYLAGLSYEEFIKIFAGENELLLLKERHQLINENFRILDKDFGGEAANLIKAANQDVNGLVSIIINKFPNFQDWVIREGAKVYFLKRAQIFASDIYYAFQGQGLGYFHNMGDLAIFADYKLPQLLQAEGVIVYTADLLEKIKSEVLIEAGSREEIEIRASTIYASELLRQQLENSGRKLTSNELDWILWVQAKQTNFFLPHHKTVTINY